MHSTSDRGRAHLHGGGMFGCGLVDGKRLAASGDGEIVGKYVSMGWSELRSYRCARSVCCLPSPSQLPFLDARGVSHRHRRFKLARDPGTPILMGLIGGIYQLEALELDVPLVLEALDIYIYIHI